MIARSDRARSFDEIAPGKTLTGLKPVELIAVLFPLYSWKTRAGLEGARIPRSCRHEGKVAAEGTVRSTVAELPMSAR